MNALHYGLTPKMKPISPRRSALVAALDVGSSKVVCLIARLRPHPPQQVLTRRSHAIEVIGFGHTAARGMKAGGVVNLAKAEEAIRQAVDSAERMAAVEIESVVLSISSGRLASELFAADIEIVGSAVSDGDIARVLAAGSRHSLRDGRAVLHSLPVGYSIDGVNGIRDPRGMLGSRFGVDMHVATTDIAAARNLMLAVERCHLDVEAMVASPYVGGPCRACRRRGRSRLRRGRYGRRHHHDGGVPRRPARPSGRLRARRPSRHHGHRPRAQCPHRRRRANQDALWQCAVAEDRTSAT